jgi:aminoglycoside 3-N-acetyltransferase
MNSRWAMLKERYFPRGIRRSATRSVNRALHRVTRASLARSLAGLQIDRGAVVCVHAALTRLGHLVDGPEAVIAALQDAIPQCTILMPTFPFTGPVAEYVAANPVYDPARTASRSGRLSEAFRRMPGARRGLHPTHPFAALGPDAAALLDGDACGSTPFGDTSTLGRFAVRPDAILLLIDTNHASVFHRAQELVDMPNLFLPDPRDVRGYDDGGQLRTYSQRIHRPDLASYIAMARDARGAAEYAWIPNYALPFPDSNRTRFLNGIADAATRRQLVARDHAFAMDGTVRQVRHGAAQIAAIRVAPWLERICADLRRSLTAFADAYALAALQAAHRDGRLRR